MQIAGLAGRLLALPFILGARWLGEPEGQQLVARGPGNPGFGVRARAALDEIFFVTELLAGAPLAVFDAERIAEETKEAVAFFQDNGWIDDPASYHRTPCAPDTIEVESAEITGLAAERISFESGYAPWEDEPGRERWLDYESNHTAHARIFRHAGEDRPWVVCIPGYRMGQEMVDTVAFRVHWLHRDLGLNVAIPVLPFHGPRTAGRRSGDFFLAGDFLDTVHAQAQAVWDTRKLIAWIREQGAPAVGIYGLSLGSYTAALVASLEDDLDCVVAGIPAVDFVDLVQANTAGWAVRLTGLLGFPWDNVCEMLRVVSPLEMPLKTDKNRCFLFAGLYDQVAPPEQARALWRHWGRPRLVWYRGGHVSFLIENEVHDLLAEALRRTGMIPDPVYTPKLLELRPALA
ncbi:MAG: alpha/beta hydrolase [Deltaproteobacteria bacterium]